MVASLWPNFWIDSCCDRSFRLPFSSNTWWAFPIAFWSGSTSTLILLRMERTWTNPRKPPNPPGEVLIKMATLSLKHTKGDSSRSGRDAQSIAFFSKVVIELLYSGQAIRNPWCAFIIALQIARPRFGHFGVVTRNAATGDNPSIYAQCGEGGFEHFAADIIEIDINPI